MTRALAASFPEQEPLRRGQPVLEAQTRWPQSPGNGARAGVGLLASLRTTALERLLCCSLRPRLYSEFAGCGLADGRQNTFPGHPTQASEMQALSTDSKQMASQVELALEGCLSRCQMGVNPCTHVPALLPDAHQRHWRGHFGVCETHK